VQRDRLTRNTRPSLESLECRWVPANVGTPNQNFIDQLYRDALHRPPDPVGAQGWVQALNTGRMQRDDVAAAILGSPEGLRTQVNDLYLRFLGRQADPLGLNAWTNFLRDNNDSHSNLEVAARLIGSPEYFQLHGGTTAGFLNALYQDALCRNIAGSELSNRLGDLGDNSRDEVAQDVLESDEARNNQVQLTFASYFRRQVSFQDANGWSNNLDRGLDGEFDDLPDNLEDNNDLLFSATLFGTAEYFQLAQTLPTTSFATIPACGNNLAAPGTPGFGTGTTGTGTGFGTGTGTGTGTTGTGTGTTGTGTTGTGTTGTGTM